jgi:hypothetical protein
MTPIIRPQKGVPEFELFHTTPISSPVHPYALLSPAIQRPRMADMFVFKKRLWQKLEENTKYAIWEKRREPSPKRLRSVT